jgi:hypothetical protein
MCKSSSATEETVSRGYKVDSVVLRIMTQEDDCICRVMIDNQIDAVSVRIRKVDGITTSAPEEAECGLAIDITHILICLRGKASFFRNACTKSGSLRFSQISGC